jgi:hypothetical protein
VKMSGDSGFAPELDQRITDSSFSEYLPKSNSFSTTITRLGTDGATRSRNSSNDAASFTARCYTRLASSTGTTAVSAGAAGSKKEGSTDEESEVILVLIA